MSGSIGGKRIKRAEVQPTLDNYIEKVLKGFPGFVSAQITGSYNAGTRADHGDIDIAVHIKGNDVKTVKKNFKAYLDSLSDDLTPKFVFGKNEGKKAQLYGAIVTCGFPINGRPEDYVQIDNIIVTNENEQRFQREFLDLDAAKQGLIMGLIRVILHHKDPNKILEYIGLVDLPKLSGNQEYEFVLSSAGLSFRRVTLNNDMREISRDEIWRSANWDIVEYILADFNLKQSYEELLEQVAKMVKNNERSRRRIVGIMKSMIKVGPGEVGTPKGIGKENAIKLAEETLNVFESLTLSEMLNNSNLTDLMEYILESEEVDPKKLVLDYVKKIPYDKRKWQDSGVSKDKYEKFCNTGKNVWFDNPKSMIKFIKDNWNRFKKWFGSDEKKMETIIDNAYSIINGKTNKTVPFVISYGNTVGIFIREDIDSSKDIIFSMVENELKDLPHNKWNFGTGFGTRALKGEGYEKKFKEQLISVLSKTESDITDEERLAKNVIDSLNVEDFSNISIIPMGKKNQRRKIFDKTFSFNSKIECGDTVADIVIKQNNKVLKYISLKDGESQTSSPSCKDILRTGFMNYKDGKNLDYYYGFCSLLGVSPDDFYNWYHSGKYDDILEINPDKNKLNKFIALIIGGGYTYVNSNGHIYEIPTSYDISGEFKYAKKMKPQKGKELKSIYFEGEINNIKAKIVFRSSDGEPYPYRFTIQSEEIDKIYELISK